MSKYNYWSYWYNYDYDDGYGYTSNYYQNLLKNYTFDWTKKAKREFKNKVEELAKEKYIPIEIDLDGSYTGAWKTTKMKFSAEHDFWKELKGKEEYIVNAYEKIPIRAEPIYGVALMTALDVRGKKSNILKYAKSGMSYEEARDICLNYFAWIIDQQKFLESFEKNMNMDNYLNDLFSMSEGWFLGHWEVWDQQDITDDETYKTFLKAIRRRITQTDKIYKEPSHNRWKRINPWFVKQTTWKPLVAKNIEHPKKKKIFIIIDSSGSMGEANYKTNPLHKAHSFAKAIYDSGKFECDYIIAHSCSGWDNMVRHYKKWEFFGYEGWAEGFEEIHNNLKAEWLRDVDYIVVLTDLCIDNKAEEGLYNFLKNWKKHLIMSFQNKGTLRGLSVRKIETPADMINSLITITS